MEPYSSWAKRALWIENDHIMCFQIASLKGIKVWPACVSYYTKGEKWQNKPISRPYYIYAGGPCFWKKELGIEILFWQQTCCSQPLEWLKLVKKYHRSLPACTLYLYGMCNTRSKTSQKKNILYSVKTHIWGKTIRYSYFILFFFLNCSIGRMDTGMGQWEIGNQN